MPLSKHAHPHIHKHTHSLIRILFQIDFYKLKHFKNFTYLYFSIASIRVRSHFTALCLSGYLSSNFPTTYSSYLLSTIQPTVLYFTNSRVSPEQFSTLSLSLCLRFLQHYTIPPPVLHVCHASVVPGPAFTNHRHRRRQLPPPVLPACVHVCVCVCVCARETVYTLFTPCN